MKFTPIGQTKEFQDLHAILRELQELYPTPAWGGPSVTGEDPCERDLWSMAEDARRKIRDCQSRESAAYFAAIHRWFTWAAEARQVNLGTWAGGRGPMIPWLKDASGEVLRGPHHKIKRTIDDLCHLHGWTIDWARVERDLDASLSAAGL